MTGWGQGGEGLRSQSFIGRQMSHVEKKKKNITEEGLGGKAGISETMKRVRHGKRSDTRDSFFCGHYGSISEADLANVMWGISATNQSWNLPQSLWQFPAHLNHLSGALLLLLAQPSYHSWLCLTCCRKKVRTIQQLIFWCAESFLNVVQGACHSHLCVFISGVT